MKLFYSINSKITLDDFLKSKYFSKKDIYLLKMEKRIMVNKAIISQNLNLLIGDVIELDVIKDEPININPIIGNLTILYEDDLILVVDKPINILIHSDGNDGITLDNLVAGYYTKTKQNHPVYHIHRLDRDTSGCVLYCKQSLLVSYFDSMLSQKKISRIYYAIVDGKISKSQTITKSIGSDRHVNNKYRVSSTGKKAITHIIPIKEYDHFTLVKCILETGRTHQIRVHLSSIGHPIIGDTLYGGSDYKRMMLHAYQLKLITPLSTQEIIVSSKVSWIK